MRFLRTILFLLVLNVSFEAAYAEPLDHSKLTKEALEILYALSPEKSNEIVFFQSLVENLKETGKENVKITLIGDGKNITFKYNLKDYSVEVIESEDEAKGLYPIRATYWEKTRYFKLSVANVDYNFILDSEGLVFSSTHSFGPLPKME